MTTPEDSGFKNINNTRIYYEVYGEGKPLICLHGGMGLDCSYFRVPGILGLVDNGIQIILYDQRGNGRSIKADDETLTHEMWVKDLVELVRVLGIDKYSVLGHSYGGWLALEHAVNKPENLNKLIIVSAHAGPIDCSKIPVLKSEREIVEHGKKIWPGSFHGKDKHWDIFNGIKQSYRAYHQAYHGDASKYDLRDSLGIIEVDTLMMVGEGEEQIRKRNEKMLKKITNSKLEVIPDCRHYAFIENPQKFISTVSNFLS